MAKPGQQYVYASRQHCFQHPIERSKAIGNELLQRMKYLDWGCS